MHTCSLESQKSGVAKTPVPTSEYTKSQGAFGYTYHPVRGYELHEVCRSWYLKVYYEKKPNTWLGILYQFNSDFATTVLTGHGNNVPDEVTVLDQFRYVFLISLNYLCKDCDNWWTER